MRPPFRPAKASRFSVLSVARPVSRSKSKNISIVDNLSLGYYGSMTNISSAASLMGQRSAEARIKQWGKREFVAKMREWGKLGGRPKGSGKKQQAKRGKNQ